ncbi:MAG: protein kinase [Deltaproteobacteria bacterium]|nr:protein kinase [Deltaproteobacteria bacterium]
MGEVYRVHDLELDEVVALKVLFPGLDRAGAADLRREVRAARAITSPHVARTFEFHCENDLAFLVMEYVEGGSLAELLRREPIGLARALAIAGDLCSAVVAAHQVGVIHRDNKPANVLLRPSGQALLTDFGIAKDLNIESSMTLHASGTPAYMSPEQVRNHSVGPATDIFALGVVTFEMLSGKLPWSRRDPISLALARLSEAPLDIQRTCDLPPALCAWVMRAIDVDAARRWSSAQEAAAALAAIVAQITPGVPSRPGAQAPPPNPAPDPARPTPVPATSIPRVAVLPFRLANTELSGSLAGLDDDLVTALSSYRGLRVVSLRAVVDAAGSTGNWQELAQRVGASHVVETAVRSIAAGVRVNVRLLASHDESVLWSGRFDFAADRLLDVGEELATTLGTQLGVVESAPLRPAVDDPRAVAMYLAARANLASEQPARIGVAIALLERATALAPTDRVITSMLALALVRHWQLTGIGGRERLQRARTLLAGLAGLSELPAEAYLANGTLNLLMGDVVGAAVALRRAVAAAPSLVQARELLGIVLLRAGHWDMAKPQLNAARQLGPALFAGRLAHCQWLALQGRWSDHDAELAALAGLAGSRQALWTWRLRAGLWRGDRSAMQALHAEMDTAGGVNADDSSLRWVSRACQAALAAAPVEQLPDDLSGRCAADVADRLQLWAEVAAWHGSPTALVAVAAAVGMGLVDLAWLERCPLLDGLREHSEWRALVEGVGRQARRIVDAVHEGDSRP